MGYKDVKKDLLFIELEFAAIVSDRRAIAGKRDDHGPFCGR